jgi:hypothetical protein
MTDPDQDPERCPTCATPAELKPRLKSMANRLRDLAMEVGGDLTVKLPTKLGDHDGLLLALANELEELIG